MPRKKSDGVVIPIRMPRRLWRDVRRVARTRYAISGAELTRAALRIVVDLRDDTPEKEAA